MRFRRRSNPKRANLRYHEIAALEVARAWPAYVDGDWADVTDALRQLVRDRVIRPAALLDAARFEPGETAKRVKALLSADR